MPRQRPERILRIKDGAVRCPMYDTLDPVEECRWCSHYGGFADERRAGVRCSYPPGRRGVVAADVRAGPCPCDV